MSTQSPGCEVLVLEQADVDDPGHPGHVDAGQVVVGVDELHQLARDPETHALSPSLARYSIDSSTSSSPPTSSISTEPHLSHASGISSRLPVCAAGRAVGPDRQQHQFGGGVLGDRAHGRHGERLVERLGMDVMELPDPHPDLGHGPVTGPALDGVDDGGAQAEFVHG